MSSFETFSKRQKRREREGQPVLYIYDKLPASFRAQVYHIVAATLAVSRLPKRAEYLRLMVSSLWDLIYSRAVREFGVLELSTTGYVSLDQTTCGRCLLYLAHDENDERVLDLIELIFNAINGPFRNIDIEHRRDGGLMDPDAAIDELNLRFREHALGYRFAEGELIRVDSEYLHAETVAPALALLHTHGFKGAEDEFMAAHRHFRLREYRDAIVDANNAFESTMKSICANWQWTYEPTASAKTLIGIVLDHNLVPEYVQEGIKGFQNLLLGLPTLRNKTGGHGQGADKIEIPEYLAAYAIHVAASNIVMLVEAHEAYSREMDDLMSSLF